MFNYQRPKVIFFDAQSLFYSEEKQEEMIKNNEDAYVHFSYDSIKNREIRQEIVEQTKEIYKETDHWKYYSTLYRTHSKWEEISESNFRAEKNDLFINGQLLLSDTLENCKRENEIEDIENNGDMEAIPEINKKYFEEIVALCKQNNTDIILLRSAGMLEWSWNRYNALEQLAKENDVKYMDINLLENEIGFLWQTDSVDGVHHNISGATKISNYLGKYIKDNYEIADARQEKIEEFEENTSLYNIRKSAMLEKIELLSSYKMNTYLEKLNSLDKQANIILLTINDDGAYSWTYRNQQLLNQLGLEKKLMNKYRFSYCALINGSEIQEKISEKNAVRLCGIIDDYYEYEIVSGGFFTEEAASIMINDKETIQGGRGINISVYNTNINDIISSVCFDTNQYANPQTGRIVNGILQYEEKTNQWKNVS